MHLLKLLMLEYGEDQELEMTVLVEVSREALSRRGYYHSH